jgi:tetratricopeptide (TPR) repeat protein
MDLSPKGGRKGREVSSRRLLRYAGMGGAPLILAVLSFLMFALFRAPVWVIAVVAAGYAVGALPLMASRLRRPGGEIEPGSPVARGPGGLTSWVIPSPEPPIGRSRELRVIEKFLRRRRGALPRVVVIRGSAGAGKTSLAAQVALRAAGRYPDGQVFVQYDDRLGYEAAARKVLRTLLGYLQEGQSELPESLAGLREAFRRASTDLSMVIIADGISEPELADAIMSAGQKCLVFFTSEQLTLPPGRAVEVRLGSLTVPDALGVLETRIGAERVSEERGPAEGIVRAAGLNPLAIRLIGSSIAEGPYWSLALAYERLMQKFEAARLSAGDTAGDAGLAIALEISYERLSDDEQRAVSLLALLDTPVFPAWMLAALLGTPPGTASKVAGGLLRAGLLERVSADAAGVQFFRAQQQVLRYAGRKLLESTGERDREEFRARLSEAQRERQRADISRSTVGAILLMQEEGSFHDALARAREAIALARDQEDRPSEALTLAALAEIQAELGYTNEADELAETAQRIGGQDSQPRALRVLGKVRRRWRQLEAAEEYLREGLQLAEANDDSPEVTRILRELAAVQAEAPDPGPALKSARVSVEVACRQPETMPVLLAGSLWSEGRALARLRRYREAEEVLQRARGEATHAGQRMWQAWISHELGRVHLDIGQRARAREDADTGLRVFAETRHRYGVAYCRKLLGEICLADGRLNDASRVLGEALDTFQNCGDPWIEAETSRILAKVRAAQDRSRDAVRLLDNAATVFEGLDDLPSLGQVLRERAASKRQRALGDWNAVQSWAGVRRPTPL